MEGFTGRVNRYIELLKQFNYWQIYNEFYDEDLTRVDYGGGWSISAALHKEHMLAFLDEAYGHLAEIKHVVINESLKLTVIECHYIFEHKEKGHVEFDQVSVQSWKDGKIIHERIHTNGADVVTHFNNQTYGHNIINKASFDNDTTGTVAA